MAPRTGKIGPQSIASLRPGELLWDTELRRFGARCRASATTYFIKPRIDGRQRWITLGKHGPLTAAEAREKARRMLAEVDSGRDPTRDREARRGMPTLAEFAKRWLDEHVALKRKPVTLREYHRIVTKHIAKELGALPIDRVERTDAIELHTRLAARRYAANRAIAVLSAVMTYAERRGLRPPASNPCRGLERFAEAKRKRPLTIDELAKLWTHLDEVEILEGPYVVAAFRLLLLTGMRKSEVLTLRWTDVNFTDRVIQLRDAKTGPRAVVLSQRAVQVFKSVPRQVGNPYVIVGEREGGHFVGLFKPWQRIRSRLGFPEVRIHDLRHTVATMLARTSPLVVVRDALGHQVIETTSGYSHAANDDVRTAVEELAVAIERAR
jgi:integrase